MPLTINDVVDHVRNLSYMSGVERDAVRVKATGEVFTPTNRVTLELDKLETLNPTLFSDPTKTFLDNSCGDGQFLGEVLIRKVQAGVDFETALSTIYGVEFMQDNVELCRRRLLCGQEHLRHIVEKNIVCADATTYNYTFGEPETFGPSGIFEIE